MSHPTWEAAPYSPVIVAAVVVGHRPTPWLRGGNVLSSYDRRRFNEIVSGLLAEDPGFGTRHSPPRRDLPRRPVVAVLLWLSMPFVIAVGGWTGLLVALVAGGYATHLWFRGRSGPHREPRTFRPPFGTPPLG